MRRARVASAENGCGAKEQFLPARSETLPFDRKSTGRRYWEILKNYDHHAKCNEAKRKLQSGTRWEDFVKGDMKFICNMPSVVYPPRIQHTLANCFPNLSKKERKSKTLNFGSSKIDPAPNLNICGVHFVRLKWSREYRTLWLQKLVNYAREFIVWEVLFFVSFFGRSFTVVSLLLLN